jgi:Macrocin-O-methyltransferase (TylF)
MTGSLYLDLLKRTLCGMTWEDPSIETAWHPESEYDVDKRVQGLDWPLHAHTMIGLARLDHLQQCAETVLADEVPGDFIETGVWRGGACILMRAILKACGVIDRAVWVADSFQGFPAHAFIVEGYSHDQDHLAVTLEQVRHNFDLYGLLDDQVRFLPGWFADTLPAAPIGQVAILRLDGDLYPSTMDALDCLYPKLAPGGFVIIDDWILPYCRKAAEDYRGKHGITEPVMPVPGSKRGGFDDISVFWRKRAAR